MFAATPSAPNGDRPSDKVLIPLADGGLVEDDHHWPSGSKTIEQRTLELLNDGYALVTTRIDGTRLFKRGSSGPVAS